MTPHDSPGGSQPANEATLLSELIIDELIAQGVSELVLCPGSRSAPLAFAAAAAARRGRLRLHVRIDERSAAFLALGLAKVSGIPVPVVCTSGSAVANLAPAIVEADYSGVPLIALTADRPVEFRGVGAPQTIDQVGFFGDSVRMALDLGAERADLSPAGSVAVDRSVRGAVAGLIGAALGAGPGGVGSACVAAGGGVQRRPGPVHCNVGFRMPLVPGGGGGLAARAGAHPRHVRRPPLAHCGFRDLASLVGEVPTRGVIVAGDIPAGVLREPQQWLAQLAGELGWPIVAEPTANLQAAPTALRHGVLVAGVADFTERHRPEMVLTAGAYGLSRATLALVGSAQRHIAIDLGTAREVCDPTRTAQQVLSAIPLAPPGFRAEPDWLAGWRAADAAVTAGLGDLSQREFTGVVAAVVTAAHVPADGLLLVAASWPVRHVEAFAAVPAGVRVVGNRGTNGIDGLVSTAWGAASAHQREGGGRAVALLGDLALLHDHNGMLAPPGAHEPDLTLVVVDNNGGGIFHQLEQGRAEYAGDFQTIFGTPHGLDLAAVCAATGRPTQVARSAAELSEVLSQSLSGGSSGVSVVVAAVADRLTEAAELDSLRQVAAAALKPSGLG